MTRTFFVLMAILTLFGCLPQTLLAQGSAIGPDVLDPVFVGESAPLSALALGFQQQRAFIKSGDDTEVPNHLDFAPPGAKSAMSTKAVQADPLRQFFHQTAPTPAPHLSFEGTSDDDNAALLGFRIVPPDTNGDVGKDYYAQMNNVILEIFDKNTGASVLGPLPNNIFFTGTGTTCEFTNSGDPIVLYDHELKRWVWSQFALVDQFGNGHQCFAISKTKDPLGAYYLYDYIITPVQLPFAGINDYPKIGVWRDGYYATFNEFGGGYLGASVVAFDKAAMANGALAIGIKFLIPFTGFAPVHFSLQAAHWEGNKKPALGAPAPVFQAFDDETWGFGAGNDGYWQWDFYADFGNPGNSQLVDNGLIPSAGFSSILCFFGECVPQPAPGELLDALAQFTMYRAQFRSFGQYDSVVISHTVDADGADTAGVRWSELRNTGSGWSVHQSGTYAPADGEHRWMPSIAQDRKGNIAIGYSVSSENTFPSIRYTGRTSHDSPGLMGAEQECIAGTGAQISSANRWGDYSSMSVDPQDGCTFYYTSEYYENTNSFDFKTRVCAFKFSNCGGNN